MTIPIITANIFIILLVIFQLRTKHFVTAEETIYTLLSPPQVYPHSDYKIHVFLQSSSNETTVIFWATLTCENSTFDSTKISMEDGSSGEIVIRTGEIMGSTCELNVVSEENGVLGPDNSNTVKVGKNEFIFLQTDKPIYKPGEMVRFRVLLMDRSSKPKPTTIEVRIFDPDRNLIKLWLNVKTDEFGLFGENMELSYEPNMGEWSIEVKTLKNAPAKHKQIEKKLGFKVDRYVLPRFDVDVELPKFRIISEIKTIPIKIKAMYLTGEGVKGNCKIQITLSSTRCSIETRKQLESYIVPIDGTVSRNLNLARHIGNETRNKARLEFQIMVTENATGKSIMEEGAVTLYTDAFKIKPDEKVSYIRPGQVFPIDFKILDHNDQIVRIKNTNATIEHNLNGEVEFIEEPIDGGIVRVNLTYNNYQDSMYIKVTYESLVYHYYVPERLKGKYLNFLIIQAPTYELTPGSNLHIIGETTDSIDLVHVVIVNNDQVILAKVIHFPNFPAEFSFTITTPHVFGSDAKLFVFTYIEDEYVGDVAKLKISQSNREESNLRISVASQTVIPGEDIYIDIASKENSLVALRGIDEALSLLTNTTDLNSKVLTGEFNSEIGRNEDRAEGFFELNESGMLIMTNSKQKPSGVVRKLEPGEEVCSIATSLSDPRNPTSRSYNRKFQLRKHFPESWLWEIFPMASNSRIRIKTKVPDTLTSWSISGYSLKPQSEIEFLAIPLKLTVFKDFFVTLDLPYSAVQGEILELNILVHNFLPGNSSSLVHVSLKREHNEFDVEGHGPYKKNIVTTKNCPANSVSSIKFEITPLQHGSLKLMVTAKTAKSTDALLQELRVIPRGQKVTQSQSEVLFVGTNGFGKEDWKKFRTNFPSNVVPGSASVKALISADIMSSSTENIESLIELPVGCGEQNMLIVASDIVILNYLNATKKLTSEIKKKGIRYLELGYQRQLTFRRSDGSFSPFGKSDTTGSTWLTAYVLKYFLLASSYIAIDDEVITKGLEFLKKQQLDDGQFDEQGRVTDSIILGEGKSKGVALAAFCLLTFLEAKKYGLAIEQEIIANGLHFYEKYFLCNYNKCQSLTQDAYAVAMVTYLELEWGNELNSTDSNSKGRKYLKHLQSMGNKESANQLMYWKLGGAENLNDSDAIKPLDIEITGYALLSYLKLYNPQDSLDIVRWLLQNQNPNGGFLSTQDTIVALTALAKYAQLTRVDKTNIRGEVMWQRNGGWRYAGGIHINETNTNHQIEYLDNEGSHSVDFTVRGTGTVYVKAVWTYFVEPEINQKDFWLEVSKNKTSRGYFFLNACTKLKKGLYTNMAIMEAHVPSGYQIDYYGLSSLRNLKNYRMFGLSWRNTDLYIYFDYISSTEDTCVSIGVYKLFSVRNPARPFVKVYDYYNPNKMSHHFYDAPE